MFEGVPVFPSADDFLGVEKGIEKRGRAVQGVLKEGAAEIGHFRIVTASEGAAVGAGRGDNHAVIVLEGVDEIYGMHVWPLIESLSI